MTGKKYELLKDDTVETPDGTTLYRIRALRDIGKFAKAGDLGGYVASEQSLSHEGDAWVSSDARVSDDARVYGNAWIFGNARVYDYAWVYDYARVHGNTRVRGDAQVSDNADILWFSHVGRENGTLTCYRGKYNQILVTRGCFSGTDEEFLAAVEEKHGSSRIGHEYRLLIEVARSRLNPQGE